MFLPSGRVLWIEPGKASAMFSPDGKWVAHASNESRRHEVYVRPFVGPSGNPGTTAPDVQWQVSIKDGDGPRLNRDGTNAN